MDITLTLAEWKQMYRPIKNPFSHSGDYFEASANDEKDFVRKQNPLTVWTYGSGDFGGRFIWNGRGANRYGYYVTEIPYGEDDMIIVVVEEAPAEPENFWTSFNLTGKE